MTEECVHEWKFDSKPVKVSGHLEVWGECRKCPRSSWFFVTPMPVKVPR